MRRAGSGSVLGTYCWGHTWASDVPCRAGLGPDARHQLCAGLAAPQPRLRRRASQDEVQAAVKLLLESKAALARARGEEPPETDKKKKKKKEKKGGEGCGAPGGEQKMSKKQLRILERQRQAVRAGGGCSRAPNCSRPHLRAPRAPQEARASEATAAQAGEASNFGELPVLQSTEITDRVWTPCEARIGGSPLQCLLTRAPAHPRCS